MNRKWSILFLISVVVILITSFNIFKYYYGYKNESDILNHMAKGKMDTLYQINSDVVGVIEVSNTDVNYPIVKGSDNSYYLNHSFNKESSKRGAIFLDYRNDLNNLSRNNVIYGHGLVDNTMFGSLDNLIDSKTDPCYVKIITNSSRMIFKVFSVYTIEKEGYYIKTYFSNDNYFKQFLDTIMERSIYDFDMEVDVYDKILTLSTCKNDFGKRIVVHAKLLKKEEIS